MDNLCAYINWFKHVFWPIDLQVTRHVWLLISFSQRHSPSYFFLIMYWYIIIYCTALLITEVTEKTYIFNYYIFRAYMHPKSNKTCIAFLYAPRAWVFGWSRSCKSSISINQSRSFFYCFSIHIKRRTRLQDVWGLTAENIVQEELLRCQQKTCNLWRIRKTYSVEERKIRGDQSAASIYV